MNQELAKEIFDIAHLTGEFKLRSGIVSNEYFDKYRFEAQPSILKKVAKEFSKMIPQTAKALAGLETGGIPLATALSLETEMPVCFVRKEAKDYGTCKFAEGIEIKGINLLVVEDVVTTGGQLVKSIADLREAGAIITDAVCVIMRGEEEKTSQIFKEINVNLKWIFTKEDLKSS